MPKAPLFQTDDATWLPHRYDLHQDRILFTHAPRDLHSKGPFLTDELMGKQPQCWQSRLEGIGRASAGRDSLHFVFHSAFCGSTLLTRALDSPGTSMGLSEPVILNDITGIRRRGELQGNQLAALMDDVLGLLARPWGQGESVVVKPSNILLGLASPIMALRPNSRAILLYAPLPIFLASVVRKGLWCRLWVRQLFEGFHREGLIDLGFEGKDYFLLTDLQIAALGWLTQHRIMHGLARQFPDRVRTLDSEIMIARPDQALNAVGLFFNLGPAAKGQASNFNLSAFEQHSKSGKAFSASARAEEYSKAFVAHGDEIEKVSLWASEVARNQGIEMTLPQPLIAIN